MSLGTSSRSNSRATRRKASKHAKRSASSSSSASDHAAVEIFMDTAELHSVSFSEPLIILTSHGGDVYEHPGLPQPISMVHPAPTVATRGIPRRQLWLQYSTGTLEVYDQCALSSESEALILDPGNTICPRAYTQALVPGKLWALLLSDVDNHSADVVRVIKRNDSEGFAKQSIASSSTSSGGCKGRVDPSCSLRLWPKESLDNVSITPAL
ncbi:hypothetical protein FA13DRAFT_1841387 [Coprinellus micaceus]|uniref:Uncharacterized protein n=1 Tax=Coprinellus micaceus TaxID=71717 RepID=A0A4Y7TD71_COPMI|nr:hypothetical protein FA13DRAFT_1841387 [Coprinellus micaceus]